MQYNCAVYRMNYASSSVITSFLYYTVAISQQKGKNC